MKITLLWSGDTIGTPVPACECVTCQDSDFNPKSHRTRFWMLIEEWDEKILIDTNPDLHWQCVRHKLRLETIGNVFITHTHSDHLNGMGEFCVRRATPTIVHHGKNPITQRNIEYFRYLDWEKVITFQTFKTGEGVIVWNLKITPIMLNHGFPCWGFIVENGLYKIGIMTDTNYILPKKTEEAIQNCDILFIDGFSENYEQIYKLFSDIREAPPENLTLTWAHLTIEQAIEKTISSKSKLGVALHISHYAAPHQTLVLKYESENFRVGYDGMVFELK